MAGSKERFSLRADDARDVIIVDERRAGSVMGKGEAGAKGRADAGGDLLDPADREIAHGVGVGADSAAEGRRFGDDVTAIPGLELADREDDRLHGSDRAADDGLEGGDKVGGDDNRINGLVGCGRMTPEPG